MYVSFIALCLFFLLHLLICFLLYFYLKAFCFDQALQNWLCFRWIWQFTRMKISWGLLRTWVKSISLVMVLQAPCINVCWRHRNQLPLSGFIVITLIICVNLRLNWKPLAVSGTEILSACMDTPFPLMETFSSMITWKMGPYGIFFMVVYSFLLSD